MLRPSNRSAGSESGRRIAREPDKENASLIEENERLQALLHLLLAIWPVGRTLVRGGSRRQEEGVDLSRGNLGTLIRDLGLPPSSEVEGIEHNTKQVRGNETQLRRS
jgi:hypothetical protein